MMSGLAMRRAGGLLVPALLLLVVPTARAQNDGGVPCGGQRRVERLTFDALVEGGASRKLPFN